MQTIDYKSQLRKLYHAATSEVELVDVPPMNFALIDGQGAPDSREYQEAVEAVFALATALKLLIRKTEAIEYAIMPLEALWWPDDTDRFSVERKAGWKWSLMIHQPTPVTRKLFEKAWSDVKTKNPSQAVAKARFETLKEGRAAQKLHIGPFSEEGPSVQAVQDRIQAIGAKAVGKHHEIYLSDLRKAAPDKWRILLRQPYI